jgi:DNA helicase HerA-like ATPase
MSDTFLFAKSSIDISLLLKMANRHGLISGATGTGKTVSLQVMAESFSKAGVPVFMADVKGDLAGMSKKGGDHSKVQERVAELKLDDFNPQSFPVTFWDIYGEKGHPVRTTISEMGPLLISRLLNLNDTQTGTLSLIFKIADDNGLLLLDLKDLRSMIQFVGENASDYNLEYGRVSKASLGAIQRNLLNLETAGGKKLFSEPALIIDDLLQSDEKGRGMINILAADKLINSPKIYGTFLLWLLSELFEIMPEVGDPEKPKLVFFFDEAHLLFDDAPKVLVDKIEQVVRLIRSKGIGIFFVTQNPIDIPDDILGQLGNRVNHALRAFTPKDQKNIKAVAQTFRSNPDLDVEAALIELEVGEALVSFLNEDGAPGVVERAMVCPPESQIGPVSDIERKEMIKNSIVYGVYEDEIDSESAYEVLKKRVEKIKANALEAAPKKRGRPKDDLLDTFVKSATRSMGNTLGRTIVRGVLGSILGK